VEPPGEQDDVTPFVTAVARQLSDAVVGVLADAAAPAPFTGDILLDLNGEEWRSRAWAAAQLRLQSHVDWDRCDLVLPCASFGEIGAASGPVAVALAVRAFTRGYARGEQTMVLSVSEDGDVGAALVARS
jgi:3-oxoacyl-[acyl-carrier-protein] synthase-1